MPEPGEGPFRGLCPFVSAFGFPEDQASARPKGGPGVPCSLGDGAVICRCSFSAAALCLLLTVVKTKAHAATVSELPHSPATVVGCFVLVCCDPLMPSMTYTQ